MFIESEHIYLRAIESSDVDLLYNIENDISIWKISQTITPFSKEILQLYLDSSHQDIYTTKQLRLMICLKQTNEAVGTIDLFDFDPMHLRGGIGILIFKNFRKKGLAYESIELVKNYVRNILMLHQIFCNISASNADSILLFEKSGFEKFGIKKQWNKISAYCFEDEYLYQLIF
jgi:diamine N-acetyltransferase